MSTEEVPGVVVLLEVSSTQIQSLMSAVFSSELVHLLQVVVEVVVLPCAEVERGGEACSIGNSLSVTACW